MRKIVCLLGFILLGCYSNATDRIITGTVTDAADGSPMPGVTVQVKNQKNGVTTDVNGKYKVVSPAGNAKLVFSFIGYETKEVKLGISDTINVALEPSTATLDEVVVNGYGRVRKQAVTESVEYEMATIMSAAPADASMYNYNTEDYSTIHENGFKRTVSDPLTTFSIDVDRAAYSNVRRFLNNGQRPPKDAVRIEEMINYFDYEPIRQAAEQPFAIKTELTASPWNKENQLLHIMLQTSKLKTDNLPPTNLVFLIDVSGSMDASNKLGLLKSAFTLLVNEMRPTDRVAIVTYAGAAGLVLPSTSGKNKEKIKAALEQLSSGGSTAGGEGIELAYKVAAEGFINDGNNRIILATDGDFNVGVSSDAGLERLIERKRESGIFLSVLGFGMGNYKDNKMETLADKGNGNYAYIDNMMEAKKVLVNEFGSTLFTVAKDVKIQMEFNPKYVQAYRLIGYENRMLNNEDFDNDKKDAGEIGSGHTVTALYELVPAGVKSNYLTASELKYQETKPVAANSNELLTLKVRYKEPTGSVSKKLEIPVRYAPVSISASSVNLRFAAAVATFGMLLRDSEYKGHATYQQAVELAANAKGVDKEGYRSEFISLVKLAEKIE